MKVAKKEEKRGTKKEKLDLPTLFVPTFCSGAILLESTKKIAVLGLFISTGQDGGFCKHLWELREAT